MGGFTQIGNKVRSAIAKATGPKKPEAICKCGHSKRAHEFYPASVELQHASGTLCLSCDCAFYEFAKKRVPGAGLKRLEDP